MQADSELRVSPGQFDGFVQSGLVDHQAGASQDAVAVSANYRLIDRAGAAKIIRIDDQTPAGGGSVN